MSKTIVFIEANSTGTTFDAMSASRGRGYSNIFITMDRPFYQALPDNPLNMADVILDCDTYSVAEILRCLREIKPDAIISFDDYHLPITAMCAMVLGLPHADVSGLISTRYKDLARECTRSTPGAVKFQVMSEKLLLETDLKSLKYPFVLKPVDESGSVSVRLCRNADDVESALKQFHLHQINLRGYRPMRSLLLEEYIEGDEYSCELFWNKELNEWSVAGITKKLLSPPPYFVEIGHIFPAPLSQSLSNLVQERVLAWLRATGLKAGAAHVEFRISNGEPYLIEINPRLPGGHITELVRWSTGINLIESYLDFHLEQKSKPVAINSVFEAAAVRFFLSSEINPNVDSLELMDSFKTMRTFQRGKVQAPTNIKNKEARSNYDRLGYVLLAGESFQSVTADLELLNSSIKN